MKHFVGQLSALFFAFFISLFPEVSKALSVPEDDIRHSISPLLSDLSMKINEHLADHSPGYVYIDKNRQGNPQLLVSGKLVLNRPLQLTPEEVLLLRDRTRKKADAIVSIVIDLPQWPLSDVHYNGSQLYPVPGASPEEHKSNQGSPGDAMMFSARPGFPEPYLLHITGSTSDISHLRVDAANLPPTSTGCYLSGIVQTPDETNTTILASETTQGLQTPNCTGPMVEAVFPGGSVRMIEATKGKKGGSKGRRPKRGETHKKPPSPSSSDQSTSYDPPPPNQGAGGGGGGRDDRDKDDKDDKPKDKFEPDSEDDQEDDEEQPRKKRGRKQKVAGAEIMTRDLRLLRRYLVRTGKKLSKNARWDSQVHHDRAKIESTLARINTAAQWRSVTAMEGFDVCRNAFDLTPPPHLGDQSGWRGTRQIDISSDDESEEEGYDPGSDEGATGYDEDYYK